MGYKANQHYTDTQSYGSYTRHFLSSFNVRTILILVVDIWSLCSKPFIDTVYPDGMSPLPYRPSPSVFLMGVWVELYQKKTDTKLFVIEFIEQNSSKTY